MEKKFYKEYELKKSKFAVNYSPVIVSDNMTGKMSGIPCISTSACDNEICMKRAQDKKSICSHCFAMATEKRYTSLSENLRKNLFLLTSEILPLDMLPRFGNVAIVRFEAFGDLMNSTQVINYFNIAKVNPLVSFALWTKNPAFIKKAIENGESKPENLTIIASSPYVNKITDFSQFDFVDHVFTVYDSKTIKAENVNINCGARCCATCRRCYKKDTEYQVSEKLK